MDGVVELGNTEMVQEDLGLIQYVTSFFMDKDHQPNPALSEHSSSNPPVPATSERSHFHFLPFTAMYPSVDPPVNTNQEDNDDDVDDDDDDDVEEDIEEEEEEEEEEEAECDSEAETGQNIHPSTSQDPLQLRDPITQCVEMAEATAEPSELMQLETSEDIRLGSPEDGSNNLESEMHMLAVSQSSRQAESANRWPLFPIQLSNGFQPPVSGAPQMEELTQEDTHYSHTVSTILQHNSGRWSESDIGCNRKSAFSRWSCRNDLLLLQPLDGVSQWVLKYILFTVPFLHNKYRDENSPKSRDMGDMAIPLRKNASQDELSANHVLAERRRREKLNERFIILRSLVPFVTKMDKASILGDTIEYVKQLRRRIQDLESRNRQMDGGDHHHTNTKDRVGLVSGGSERRKLRIVEGVGGVKSKVVEGVSMVGNVVQVSIIECDALIELKCSYRDGLLLEIMQKLRDLRMEITTVQFSSTNGVFIAELRAKVKENSNGRKVTIVEVKRAIHQIIAQY